MNSILKVTKRTEGYHSTLYLRMCLDPKPSEVIKVECISTGRSSTRYEIYDGNGDFMGGRTFEASWCPVIAQFTKALVEDLNVLLGDIFTVDNFLMIAREAVNKCESRYGNRIPEGDCIITIW
jgi:hypothetical protein